MWKKDGDSAHMEAATYAPNAVDQIKQRTKQASIGPSISIHGNLTGEEDLTIEGQVHGKIDLGKYNVTIGKEARVKADVYGRVISVEGHVVGDLCGSEKIAIRATGSVLGNLLAPRINLEEGASFKGSIDMEVSEDHPERLRSGETEEKTAEFEAAASPQKTLNLSSGKVSSLAGRK